jgi:prevent-host-death family protein
MDTASITQVKNGLSALIDRVRGGESIVILDRGIPVARLEPVTTLDDPSGRLRRLERGGVVRAGVGVVPVDLLLADGPSLSPGASAVAAVILERQAGR